MELNIKFINEFINKFQTNGIIYFFENCFTNAKLKQVLWCHDNYCKLSPKKDPSIKTYCGFSEDICSTYINEHIDLLIKNKSMYPLMSVDYTKNIDCDKCDKSLSNICYAHNNTNIEDNLAKTNQTKYQCMCNGYWTQTINNVAFICKKCNNYQLYDFIPLKKCNNCNKSIKNLQIDSDINDRCDNCRNSDFDILYDENICIDNKSLKCYYCDTFDDIIQYGIVRDSYDLCNKCYNTEKNMTFIKSTPYIEYYPHDTTIVQFKCDCSKYYQLIYEYIDSNNITTEITLHYLNSCCSVFDKLLFNKITCDDVCNIIEICQNKSNDLNYDILRKTCLNFYK